jgi:hypothetical protein
MLEVCCIVSPCSPESVVPSESSIHALLSTIAEMLLYLLILINDWSEGLGANKVLWIMARRAKKR